MDFFKPLDLKEETQKVDITRVERVRCLIIGSGPAGYTAAIYTSRANLQPVLFTGLQMGGQLTTTTDVENFPGYPDGVSGQALMEDLRRQAEKFGTDVRFGIVTDVDFTGPVHKVIVDGEKVIESYAIIIATGATAKYLGLEAERKYAGMGVSACATCDGFFYKGKDVAVVGGGDTAAEESTYLAGLCRKVYLVVRRNELRASKVMQREVFNTPNIEILWEHQAIDLFGDNGVEGVVLVKKKGTPEEESVKLKIDGFFLAIGHKPNSEVFSRFIETDQTGYIKTFPGTTKTKVPGIFAAGDVQDPIYRQAVSAAGSGCMAAIEAERYLAEIHK